ncbi:SPOSA6832_03542, partial [Sporobolomyces salmonicolor]
MSTSTAAPSTSTVTVTQDTNPRGIPKAVFLVRLVLPLALSARQLADFESVQDYLGGPDGDAELALKNLQETLAKYRFMEQSSLQRRAGLEEKVPELQRTIEMVEMLIRKKALREFDTTTHALTLELFGREQEQAEPFETTFELSDTLYAKGEVEQVDEVYIWLGASTMLSYPLPSALSLLQSKLAAAQRSLEHVKEDLLWLRDQVTVTEVNVARVYNWDVARRRERRQQG